MPGTLVSSRPSAPASGPVRTNPFASRATVSPSHSVQGEAPRKRKRKESGSSVAVGQGDAVEPAVLAVQGGDFAAVADGDAVALELLDQVLGHRLAEVGAAVQEGDQRAAAGQPDGGLRGRVAAADDADPLGAAEVGLGRAGGVEDADPLVAVEVVDRQAAVFGAGREQHRAGDDLVAFVERDDVAPVARLQRAGAVRGRRAGAELARLGDRPAGQLGAADPGREAEVVLDPPRGARLAAEHGALDEQRVEALRGAVDGGAEPGRAAADDEQVDLLPLRQLEPDAQRPRELAVARPAQLVAAGQPHQRQLVGLAASSISAAASTFSAGSSQVLGRRRLRAKSSSRRVSAESRGPTISIPIPSRCWSSSRRSTKAESSRSESEPSSKRSCRSSSRSTAM